MHNELLCQCYGSEEINTKFGVVRRPVKRSNDATRGDYSELIETLCRVAAEMGYDVPPQLGRKDHEGNDCFSSATMILDVL